MRGRKPLSQELLKLRGTDRKDRQRPAATAGELIPLEAIGQCQVAGLHSATRRARDIYWRVVRQMASLKLLERPFLSQALFYSIEYDHFLTLTEDIRKNGVVMKGADKGGNTIYFPNPAVKMRDKSLELLLKLSSNFGFSPVDKQRIRVQQEDPKEQKLKALFAMVYEDKDEGADDQ